MGYTRPQLQKLEDCVARRNLFLVHVGHSWAVIRATGKGSAQGGAIPLPLLNKLFPKAAMVVEVRKFTNAEDLRKYMKAVDMTGEHILQQLNRPLSESGYEILLAASSINLPFKLD